MPVIDRLSERQAELYAEPEMRSGVMGELVEHFRNRLLREANLERLTNLPPQILRAKIESLIGAMIREEGRVISYADRARLITFITNETAGYGPLEILLRDPTITEIMVNAPNEVYIERGGRLQRRADVSFTDEEHIRHIIDRIVSPIGRRIDESSPMVDARLPDGSRVNAIIPPLALNGPTLTIRRFREDPYEVEDLFGLGTLTEDMAEFLRACVIARLNILISGGTGSGKTTTLNVLASYIPHGERVITVEDAAELQFYKTHPHVLRQEARPPNVEGEGEVTIRQLVRNALRMRPNRIVVGEVRGAEALDMLQAMNTGHDGSLTTVHANSPEDAFSRLETMVMWAGTELPSAAIREQLVGALNIIIQQDRLPDGTRKITSVSEILGVKRGEIVTREIFRFDQIGIDEATGKVLGTHVPTGIRPKCLARLKAEGVGVSPSMFIPAHKIVEDLRADPEVTEIMVNGPDKVYVERKGKIEERPDIRFRDEYHLRSYINTIVVPLGRRIDEDTPMVDARLPDGSRVNAAIPPVSVDSPVLTIRLFRRAPFSVEELLKFGTFSEDMVLFLESCVRAKLNVLISGGTGSGKTTTLNLLSGFISKDERIVTVEDVAELRLRQPHVVRMEARPPDEEGEGEVTIRDLVVNALRQRPDRIIVGEVRGAETLDMLQAMNTGHDGSLTTIHANSPEDALSRLETMVMWAGTDLPSSAIRDQIVGAIDIIVQQDRMSDGSRKLTSLAEVQGIKKGEIVIRDIFSFVQVGVDEETDKVLGSFAPTGIRPKALARLKARGIDLPESTFIPAHRIVEDLRQDPDITEIMVNGPDRVYIERKGKIEERPDIRFRDEYHLRSYINTIVTPLGRRLDEDNPLVDARLPDGSRVNAAIPPASVEGPVLTIRLFRPVPFSVDDLLKLGAFSQDMIAFLEGCVRAKLNILISGGTGSGKTTTLNVLSGFIPESERVVTVEDVAELQLRQPHVVRMEARPPDEEGEGEITIRDLVRNALRMRPDRIVVGEVRGGEALDMLQAMNTGHEGSLTTIHANSPADAFSRLETMVMWAGVELPSAAVREQMVGALDIVIQQARLVDGSRRILTVSEIQGLKDGHIALKDIFVFDQGGIGADGKVLGKFKSTGFTPRCLSQLKNFGVKLSAKMFAGK